MAWTPPRLTAAAPCRAIRAPQVSGSQTASQYNYPNPLLVASFEHLTALGLVIPAAASGRHKSLSTEHMPLRLGTDAQTLHDFVKNHTELPLEVQRFGTQQTL